MSQYLLINRLRVQAANALSSPLTFGFPAVTAFLGFSHALQRHVNRAEGSDSFCVSGVGIVCHQFEMLDHADGYSRTLQLTANPLNEKGERASFIEEGRCHMTVSLVLEVSGLSGGARQLTSIGQLIFAKMKLAGGDILSRPTVEFLADERKSLGRLMPGYALQERRQLMVEAMQGGDDALQALHRYLQVEHRSTVSSDGDVTWSAQRHSTGWLVPIATGFHAVSPVGPALQTRDTATPHRFAESTITLGEFVLPTRQKGLSELLWRYHHDGDLYVGTQSQKPQTASQEN